jgi:ribosome biogenesis protein ENP2
MARTKKRYVLPTTDGGTVIASSRSKQRVEVVHDLDFATTSSRVRFSPDGDFMMLTGAYPPTVKMYELAHLSQKFSRTLDAEVVDAVFLSRDYKKFAMLQDDRHIEVHSQGGSHYRMKLPRVGRAIEYNPRTADLYAVGSSGDVFRLNLDLGRFMAPYRTQVRVADGMSHSVSVNAIATSAVHGLVAAGTSSGTVECFDPRTKAKEPISVLEVGAIAASFADAGVDAFGASLGTPEVTSVAHSPSGLHLAVGTSNGVAMIFDLRATLPTSHRIHGYGFPIHTIQFHGASGANVVSGDKRAIRAWEAESGKLLASVESAEADINHFGVCGDSGLIVAPVEASKVATWFVPQLGPAPSWAQHLDSAAADAEAADDDDDERAKLYDNFTFVTRSELAELNLAHLVGTPLLRDYMHGFFVATKFYQEAVAAAKPDAYATWRAERIAAKLEARKTARAHLPPRVALPADADADADGADEAHAEAAQELGQEPTLLEDDRFAALFSDPAFAVDSTAEAFQDRQPHRSKR